MADYANSSSKLLVVSSRTSQCHGLSWWPIGIGFVMFYVFSFPPGVYVGTLNLIASIPGPSVLTNQMHDGFIMVCTYVELLLKLITHKIAF